MDEYVELQFVGGISRRMICEVVFDFAPDDRLVQELRVHHILWRTNPIPEIPEHLGGIVGPLPADILTEH